MIIQSAGGLFVFLSNCRVGYENRQMVNWILTQLG